MLTSTTDLDFAIDAVREAGLLAEEVQRELVSPGLTKEDRSPVTVADFAAQALIAHRMSERLPDAVLIGEESSAALQTEEGQKLLVKITEFLARRIPGVDAKQVVKLIDRGTGEPPKSFWTLDPIDGTKGFLRGDQYAVAFARITDGKVDLGVLGCPDLNASSKPGGHKCDGTLAVAARDEGARWTSLRDLGEWHSLKVSDRSNAKDTRLLRSAESAHTNTGKIGQIIARLGIAAPAIPLDSQAKYAVLSSGTGDAMVRLLTAKQPDYCERIWDQAAGSIVIEEAGGRVTDLGGKPLDFSKGRTLAENRGILATNGLLHDALLEVLKEVGA